MNNKLQSQNINNLFDKISVLLESARQKIVVLVSTYFQIGRIIVEDEQDGKQRAAYGKSQLKKLSNQLSAEFGKGFSVDNLENMRKFYLTYSKSETLSRIFKLSWSHYLFLMRLEEPIRNFYEIESIENSWSLRELQRQFDTALYERLSLSRNKSKVKELNEKGQVITKPQDAIKDPYILEFLG